MRIKFKLSGNEVYYTNSFIFLVINMLCSKLHYQKVLIQKLFDIRLPGRPKGAWKHHELAHLLLAHLPLKKEVSVLGSKVSHNCESVPRRARM